jgi:murein DD-endopeptidase MepM/ murein hydrolase activator NlpD
MLKETIFKVRKFLGIKLVTILFSLSMIKWLIVKKVKVLYLVIKPIVIKNLKIIINQSKVIIKEIFFKLNAFLKTIIKVVNQEIIRFKSGMFKLNKPAWLLSGLIFFMFIVAVNFQVQSNKKTAKMMVLVQALKLENQGKNNLIAITHKILEDQHNIYGVGGTSREILKKAITNYTDFNKINKMPTTSNQLDIETNIKYHGLKNYSLAYDDMIFPIDTEYSYIPSSAAEFGNRWLELDVPEGLKFHNGIDINNPYNDDVIAPKDGIVTNLGFDIHGGNFVEITPFNNPDQRLIVYHLGKIFAKEGQKVKIGERIGLAGNTGNWTSGKHVHFEIKEKINNLWYYVNPISISTNQKYIVKMKRMY